jgi:integrase
MTEDAVRKIVARAGRGAGLPFSIHPHMLRHAAGYKLANDGQDTRAIQHYLGHRNIAHTVRYTELSNRRESLKQTRLEQPFRRESLGDPFHIRFFQKAVIDLQDILNHRLMMRNGC